MTDEQQAELAALKSKLKARDGQPGWAKSCEAIKARIAELEALND